MTFRRLLSAVLILLCLTSCFSGSVAGRYRDVLGIEWETRKDMTLWKMEPNQFRFVPYTLSNTDYGNLAHRVKLVPAGSRIRVVDARVKSTIDAGFDYLIADLYLPGGEAPIRFEQIVEDMSVEYFRTAWQKVKQ